MIEVKSLNINFYDNHVIQGVDFTVDKAETLVILGRNGAGKSVILKCVAGLLSDFQGTVQIDGVDITKYYAGREASEHGAQKKAGVAYVFQKGGLFDSMSVFDNTAFGLRRLGVDETGVDDSVSNAIYRVGLKGSEQKLPSELSGGMQKRVGLARAVCMSPDLILYDDPTAGLDPMLSDSIADLMLEIQDSTGATSIVVTHDLMVARKVADNIALLYRGKFVFYGSTESFFSMENSYARQFINGDIEGPIDIY
jgi:phospholipid/cholesterol/gamma-HCH transport system ATP-binding protein